MEFAKANGIHKCFEASKLTGYNVEEVFQYALLDCYFNRQKSLTDGIPDDAGEFKVSGKVDGLEKYMLCLPFYDIQLSVFHSTIKNSGGEQNKISLDWLRNQFQNDPNWIDQENPDTYVDDFFEKYLSAIDLPAFSSFTDVEMLHLFSIYACKSVNKEEMALIITEIIQS